MKKILSILIAVIIACSFAACSGDKAPSNNNTSSIQVDLSAVKNVMIQQLSPTDPIDIQADALLNLYGIAAEDIESAACYTTMDGAFPEEVVMVKAKDGEALKRIEEKMNNRIAEVKVQSQSYDAENYAIAQKSEVQKNGNYIAMFLSPDYDSLVDIFKSNFEG
ncbi:MAG: DUF4358 domain-containing protein [Clostridia bacterium]|nr:DUF4358 domain-containing protein [Clostridia bacterium]